MSTGFIKLNHVILGAATKAFWSFCNVVSKLLGVMFVMYFLSQIQVKLAKGTLIWVDINHCKLVTVAWHKVTLIDEGGLGTSRYINEAAALKICSELVTSDHQWAVLLNAGLWDHIVLSPIALTLQYGLLLVNMVISSVFMIGIYTTVCRSLSSKPSRKPVIPHNSLH